MLLLIGVVAAGLDPKPKDTNTQGSISNKKEDNTTSDLHTKKRNR